LLQTKLLQFIPTPEKRKEEKLLKKQQFLRESLQEQNQMEEFIHKQFSIFTFTVTKPNPTSYKTQTIGIHFSEPKTLLEIIAIIKKGIIEIEKEKTNEKTN